MPEDQSEQTGGDYGYDLAHEVTHGGRRKPSPASPEHGAPPSKHPPVTGVTEPPTEPEGDYGYDLAHEPPS